MLGIRVGLYFDTDVQNLQVDITLNCSLHYTPSPQFIDKHNISTNVLFSFKFGESRYNCQNKLTLGCVSDSTDIYDLQMSLLDMVSNQNNMEMILFDGFR
jgi:hypothetical protein